LFSEVHSWTNHPPCRKYRRNGSDEYIVCCDFPTSPKIPLELDLVIELRYRTMPLVFCEFALTFRNSD
uniref:MRF_C2 domain-containing protein n=1 Tax=Haemonchus placei TaxID=6290 RepID=A0A0N4WTD2_HAEPC